MGVDYYECHKCGRGFRDDSNYCIYCGCGAHFCNDICAQPKYETVEETDDDDSYEECVSCVICRNICNKALERYTRSNGVAINQPIASTEMLGASPSL